MTQSDPTDHALAAIASILDQPPAPSEPKNSDKSSEKTPSVPADEAKSETVAIPVREQPDPANYSKYGPGPLAAIRFRWTSRRDEAGLYFVDETIGPHSRPLTTGPMPAEDVIPFIDDRAAEAQQRFKLLKTEMTTGLPASGRRDDGTGSER